MCRTTVNLRIPSVTSSQWQVTLWKMNSHSIIQAIYLLGFGVCMSDIQAMLQASRHQCCCGLPEYFVHTINSIYATAFWPWSWSFIHTSTLTTPALYHYYNNCLDRGIYRDSYTICLSLPSLSEKALPVCELMMNVVCVVIGCTIATHHTEWKQAYLLYRCYQWLHHCHTSYRMETVLSSIQVLPVAAPLPSIAWCCFDLALETVL